jgi:fermentation-respiration switch protein FrsA (DUF1100 family)
VRFGVPGGEDAQPLVGGRVRFGGENHEALAAAVGAVPGVTVEGFEYYISGPTRHPRSAKFLTWSSIDHMAFFDAFRFVSLIGQRPLLMIVGREAVTSWMSIQAFQNATGPKELHWMDGASHNDLCNKEQYVGPAVTKLTGFFTQNLAAGRMPAAVASA